MGSKAYELSKNIKDIIETNPTLKHDKGKVEITRDILSSPLPVVFRFDHPDTVHKYFFTMQFNHWRSSSTKKVSKSNWILSPKIKGGETHVVTCNFYEDQELTKKLISVDVKFEMRNLKSATVDELYETLITNNFYESGTEILNALKTPLKLSKTRETKPTLTSYHTRKHLESMYPPEIMTELYDNISDALEDTGEAKIFLRDGSVVGSASNFDDAVELLHSILVRDSDTGEYNFANIGNQFAISALAKTHDGFPALNTKVYEIGNNGSLEIKDSALKKYTGKELMTKGFTSNDQKENAVKLLSKNEIKYHRDEPGNIKLKSVPMTQKRVNKYRKYLSRYS